MKDTTKHQYSRLLPLGKLQEIPKTSNRILSAFMCLKGTLVILHFLTVLLVFGIFFSLSQKQ